MIKTICALSLVFALFILSAQPTNATYNETIDRYVVQKGDTLWDIAGHYYKNSYQWTAIWLANEKSDVISVLANGNPLIIPGATLIIPKLKEKQGIITAEDITYHAGEFTTTAVVFNPKDSYWLIGGYEWPPLSERGKTGEKESWYYPKPEQDNAMLYSYDGEKVLLLNKKIRAITNNQITALGFDGAKFWIAAGNDYGTDAQLITYDGKQLTDLTSIIEDQNINISFIEGNEKTLLLGGCKEHTRQGKPFLGVIINGTFTDLTNRIGEGRRRCVQALKYNGEYWLIAIDTQLYLFDGQELLYLSDREELRSIEQQWNAGISNFAWDPQKKIWLLKGWNTYALYDPISRTLKQPEEKIEHRTSYFNVEAVEYSPLGWFIVDTWGRLTFYQNQVVIPSPGGKVDGQGPIVRASCSPSACLMGNGNKFHANQLLKITWNVARKW